MHQKRSYGDKRHKWGNGFTWGWAEKMSYCWAIFSINCIAVGRVLNKYKELFFLQKKPTVFSQNQSSSCWRNVVISIKSNSSTLPQKINVLLIMRQGIVCPSPSNVKPVVLQISFEFTVPVAFNSSVPCPLMIWAFFFSFPAFEDKELYGCVPEKEKKKCTEEESGLIECVLHGGHGELWGNCCFQLKSFCSLGLLPAGISALEFLIISLLARCCHSSARL